MHLALRADWEAARDAGAYTISTRGRTLAEEGFVHCSRGDQWQGVRERFYADVTEPMVLLVVDTDRLGVPVVDEAPPGAPAGSETFPHVYGPIPADAVVQVLPLDPDGRVAEQQSFTRLFLREVAVRVVVTTVVLLAAVVGTLVGLTGEADWAPLAGLVIGAALGVAGVLVVRSARRRRFGT